MNIRFSRHARQRLKLYGVSRNDILELLAIDKAEEQPLNVKRELISNDFVEKYGYGLYSGTAWNNDHHKLSVRSGDAL